MAKATAAATHKPRKSILPVVIDQIPLREIENAILGAALWNGIDLDQRRRTGFRALPGAVTRRKYPQIVNNPLA